MGCPGGNAVMCTPTAGYAKSPQLPVDSSGYVHNSVKPNWYAGRIVISSVDTLGNIFVQVCS
jgi:hypothetical protein